MAEGGGLSGDDKEIVGYARVSSMEQAVDSHALEQQVSRLKAAGATKILVDIERRTKSDRKNLVEMLRDVSLGLIKEVVITRLDRLGAGLSAMDSAVKVFLQSGGILRALDNNVDMRNASGRLHLNFLASISQFEVEQLGERVRHGIKFRQKRGAAFVPPWGYKVKDEQYVLDHEPILCHLETQREVSPADMARHLVEIFLEVGTLSATSRAYAEYYIGTDVVRTKDPGTGNKKQLWIKWSPTGLGQWLTNPTLEGHTVYYFKRGPKEWDAHWDTHPDQRLISAEEGRRIVRTIADASKVGGYGARGPRHPLVGRVFCDSCQSSCTRAKTRGAAKEGVVKEYKYWVCTMAPRKMCSQHRHTKWAVFKEGINEALRNKAAEIANFVEAGEDASSKEVQELERQLTGLEALGYNVVFEDTKRLLRGQIEAIKIAHRNNSPSAYAWEVYKDAFQSSDFWDSLSEEEWSRITEMHVSRVWLKDARVNRVDLRL